MEGQGTPSSACPHIMTHIEATIYQAKLRTLHEVVVRNRLEQLRKRQRDEALQAQEELLAGVAKSAQRGDVRGVAPVNTAEQDAAEVVEPYDRSMSPPLIDIRKLHHEEREIDILTTVEDLRQLVCVWSGLSYVP